MEFTKLVKERRSCRSFVPEKVEKADIEEIIKCALLAPSWKNSETGRYYVALDETMIEKVYDCLPDFNKQASKNASYIIATLKKGISGNGNDEWGCYDLGLQNAYLLLKAKDLGYDTLIMGLRDEDKLRQLFSIQEDEIMLPVIAIGKRNGELANPKRKELNEVLKVY